MIIFIHGPDTFRSREKLHSLITEFKKKRDPQGYNVVRLDGARLTLNQFRHEVLSSGFLAPKRMIIVEGLLQRGNKAVTDAVAEFLSSHQQIVGKEGNVVVFWEGGEGANVVPARLSRIKAKGRTLKIKRRETGGVLRDLLLKQEYVFAFPLLDGAELKQWLRARAKECGAALSSAVVEHLVAYSGNDIWRLDREFAKLTALRKGGTIALHDVEEAGEIEVEPTGFAFTDAVATRSVPAALKELHTLAVVGVEPLLIHSMLVRLFRTISLVKSYLEDDHVDDSSSNAAEDLGLHPFVVKKTAPLVRRFSWGDVREVYRRLLALDLNVKRQGDDPYLPLELFVMNLDTLTPSSH